MPALERGLTVLEAIARSRTGLSYGEFAPLGIPGASLVRILRTLYRRGFLRQSPGSNRYRLGLRLHALGMAALASLEVVQEAAPVLLRLATETSETAELVLLDADELTWAATADAPGGVRLAGQAATGLRTDRLHSTAPGKLFLALENRLDPGAAVSARPGSESSLLERYLAAHDLSRFTPHTITDPQKLQEELDAIRVRGYAVDREENRSGLWRCAAPVYDASGALAAALGIAGPITCYSWARERAIADACLAAAEAVTRALGSVRTGPAGSSGF